jgi:hypothetical protein
MSARNIAIIAKVAISESEDRVFVCALAMIESMLSISIITTLESNFAMAARTSGTGEGGVLTRRSAEGNTRKPRVLRIASVRKGRQPDAAANPGEAESAQVGVT